MFPLSSRNGDATESLIGWHLEQLLALTIPEDGDSRPLLEGTGHFGFAGGASWALPAAPALHDDDDFVFSYAAPAATRPDTAAGYAARVVDLLCETVDLLENGDVVVPAALLMDDERIPIAPLPAAAALNIGERAEGKRAIARSRQPLHSVASSEPAIVGLARHWGLLSSLSGVLADPAGRSIEGFRLRRLADWIVPISGNPSEVYEYLARACNVSCKFCYLYGNPKNMAVARGIKVISRNEIDTRLRYFDPEAKTGLFRAQWEINEFLVDPKMPSVLRELRQKTEDPFFFITNGSPLTEEAMDLLEAVQPVHLIVSTNSLDAPLRSALMNETRAQTQTALECLQRLRERGLPYGVSLVAFPEVPLAELGQTIRRLDNIRPAFIRVNLPGFTRDHPYQGDFDTEEWWSEVAGLLRRLRGEMKTPLLCIPSAFEENYFHEDPNAARILGTVPGSPASRADLRPGDVIHRVQDFEVRTRSDLQALLFLLEGEIRLEVERKGKALTTAFDAGAPTTYPYSGHRLGKYTFCHGIVSAPSLARDSAMEVVDAMDDAGARSVWILTSRIMKPAASALLRRYAPATLERIRFVDVDNDFLGGNIRVLDMGTGGDMVNAVESFRESGAPNPDLILAPGTGFNALGRDIMGRHWKDIERELGSPVRLLNAHTRFPF